jgi:hypothetical protein
VYSTDHDWDTTEVVPSVYEFDRSVHVVAAPVALLIRHSVVAPACVAVSNNWKDATTLVLDPVPAA